MSRREVTPELIETLIKNGRLFQYSANLWVCYHKHTHNRFFGATAEEAICRYDNANRRPHEDSGVE